jgi:hypothetical protein
MGDVRRFIVAGIALVGLGACISSPQTAPVSSTPSQEPIATFTEEIALDPSTSTPGPITQTTPSIVLEPAVLDPTETPFLSNVGLPPAAMHIFQPGPGSQVRSPIRVLGRGGPSFNDAIRVELIGEDGRLISSRYAYIMAFPGGSGRFVIEISFDIALVAESARLSVSAESLRYRQLKQLASVNLVLLSTGTELVHPAIDGPEKLAIFSPRDGTVAEGGVVHARGAGWVDSENPLIVELIDRDDAVLSSVEVFLDPHEVGRVGEFSVDLPYQISFSQYARVVVRELGSEIPGIIHYSSVEVYLRR